MKEKRKERLAVVINGLVLIASAIFLNRTEILIALTLLVIFDIVMLAIEILKK